MARPPLRHPDDAEAVLYVRIPGWLKNQITDLADTDDVSLATFVGVALRDIARDKRGLPVPPPPAAPMPDAAAMLRAYVEGDHVLTPCGRKDRCAGMETEPVKIGSVRFCGSCDIRIE